MNAVRFFLASALGFGIRYAFLEYMGYNSIFIFTASFDYSQRAIIALFLIAASIYVALSLCWKTLDPIVQNQPHD